MSITQIVGSVIALVGSLMMIYYSFVLIIRAFKEHILWGIGYLIVPFVNLVFICVKWQVAKAPLLKTLLWFAVAAVGLFVAQLGTTT